MIPFKKKIEVVGPFRLILQQASNIFITKIPMTLRIPDSDQKSRELLHTHDSPYSYPVYTRYGKEAWYIDSRHEYRAGPFFYCLIKLTF